MGLRSTYCFHSFQVSRWRVKDVFSDLAGLHSLYVEITLSISGLGDLDELNLCGLSTSRKFFLFRYNGICDTLQRLLLLNHLLDNLLLDSILIFVEIFLEVLVTTTDTGGDVVSWAI